MESNNIRQRALLVSLHVSLPTGRKENKVAAFETCQRNDAVADAGTFSQMILPKDALLPIKQHVTAARDWHYRNTLPFYEAEDGRRFITNSHFLRYSDELKGRQETYKTLRAQFLGNYPAHIEAMKAPLGKLFNPDHYPTLEEISDKFSWKMSIEPIPSGADVRIDLAEEELAVLQRDLDKRVEAAARMAQRDLYRRLFEPLSRMVERLADPSLTFRDTLVSNLTEVCEVIPKLSLDDDLELASLVDSARQLTLHAPAVLREDVRVRSDVAKRAQEITERMAAFFPAQSVAA